MREYGLKLTRLHGKSAYDKFFVYPTIGEIVCPNADSESKEPCGRGIHIALSLSGGLKYVSDPAEIRLVRLTGKLLGKDKDKARYNKCEVLCVLPNQLYKDYQAKRDPLDKDYQAKKDQLYKDYWDKKDQLYKDYQAKRDPLDKDYQAKRDPLDKAFMRGAIRYYKSLLAKQNGAEAT